MPDPAATLQAVLGATLSSPPQVTFQVAGGAAKDAVQSPQGLCIYVQRTQGKGDDSSRILLLNKDQSVSSQHAEIRWSGTHWLLRDSGSRMGTRHNKQALQPYADTVALQDGDELQFGDARVRVQMSPRAVGDMTVEQMMQAHAEAAISRFLAEQAAAIHQVKTQFDTEAARVLSTLPVAAPNS